MSQHQQFNLQSEINIGGRSQRKIQGRKAKAKGGNRKKKIC